MKKSIACSFSLLLTLLCAIAATAQSPANAQLTPEDKAATAKIAQMLEASEQTYTKTSDGIWVVKFKGNHRPDIAVVTIYAKGMLIFVAGVAEKGEFKPSLELMQKLLGLNDSMDRVKVMIDERGDIALRLDLTLRVVDQQEFNANLEQISAAADETYGVVKPFLLAPKRATK